MNMTEIELTKPEHFLTIKESLERMGTKDVINKTLTPSCYILHKNNKYFILHYQELKILDGGDDIYTKDQNSHKHMCIELLEQWNLCKRVEQVTYDRVKDLAVLKHSEKNDWGTWHMYDIGIN